MMPTGGYLKITLKQLSQSFGALQELAQVQFPAKVSYRLSRVVTSAQAELETLQKAHLELIKKHGAVETDGKFEVPKDRLEAFIPEYDGLLSEEVTIWGDAIGIDLLGDAEIAPVVLAPLSWLIVDTAEPEKVRAANG